MTREKDGLSDFPSDQSGYLLLTRSGGASEVPVTVQPFAPFQMVYLNEREIWENGRLMDNLGGCDAKPANPGDSRG